LSQNRGMQQGELTRDQVAIALDFPDAASALRMADTLGGEGLIYKLGLQLFIANGPQVIRGLKQRGARVFLDLKLHDIPNTVAGAVRSANFWDVDYLTIHLGGGRRMIEAACNAAASKLLLLGVSVLTSLDEEALHEMGVERKMEDQVLALAGMGIEAGIRGVVCSPVEAPLMRQVFGPNLFLATPGVRPTGSDANDQVRVTTPQQALANGSSLLVIGRPITAAPDPRAALEAILKGES